MISFFKIIFRCAGFFEHSWKIENVVFIIKNPRNRNLHVFKSNYQIIIFFFKNYEILTRYECVEKLAIGCIIWMIYLELSWFFYDPSWMLQLSEFVWTLRSSACVVFNNFLLIDATDRSKISSDQKQLLFAINLYTLSFLIIFIMHIGRCSYYIECFFFCEKNI